MSSKLKLSDCKCPICMCIFIEPVTMPCRHQLCITCFRKNVEEASLTCPMCRTRISTWARKAAKQKKLVDEKFWKQIQECFPSKVQNRLEGKENDDDSSEEEADDLPYNYLQLSTPGAIREEYEKEMKKIEEERTLKEQEEFAASQKLIERLKQEEEKEIQRRNKELEMQKLKDEALAKEINDAINMSIAVTDSPEPTQMLSNASKKYNNNKGTPVRKTTMLDKFITRGTRSAEISSPNNRQEREQGSPWESFLDPEKSTAEFTFADSRTASRMEKLPSLDFPHLDLKGDDSLLNADDVMPGALRESGGAASAQSVQSVSSCQGEVDKDGLLDSKCDPSHMQILASSSSTSASSCSDTSSWIETKVVSSSGQSSARVLHSEGTTDNSDGLLHVKSACESSHITGGDTKAKSVESTNRGNSHWKPSTSAKNSTVTKSSEQPQDGNTTKPLTIVDKLKRQRSNSVDSGDSISMELLHFKPIHRSPLTPPKRLPGGKVLEAPIIRSTPMNISRQNSQSDSEGTCLSPQNPVGSPIMLVRLQELAAERQEQVTLHSKGTSTDNEIAIRRDHSYSSPSRQAEKKKDKGLQRNMKPKGLWKQRAECSATVATSCEEVVKLNLPHTSAFQDLKVQESVTSQKSSGCEIIPLEPNIENSSADTSLPQFFQNFSGEQTEDTLIKESHKREVLTSSGKAPVTSTTNNTASQTGVKGSSSESSSDQEKSSGEGKKSTAAHPCENSPGKVYKMKKSPVTQSIKNTIQSPKGVVEKDETMKNIKSWLKKVQNPSPNSEHYLMCTAENETLIHEEREFYNNNATRKIPSPKKCNDLKTNQIDEFSKSGQTGRTSKSDECISSKSKRQKKVKGSGHEQCVEKTEPPPSGDKSNKDKAKDLDSPKRHQSTATDCDKSYNKLTPKSPRTRKGSGKQFDPIVVSSAETSTKKESVVKTLWRSPRKKKIADTFTECEPEKVVKTSPVKRKGKVKNKTLNENEIDDIHRSTNMDNTEAVEETKVTKKQDKKKKTTESSSDEKRVSPRKSRISKVEVSKVEKGNSAEKNIESEEKSQDTQVTNENKKTRKCKDIEYSPSEHGKKVKRARTTSKSDQAANYSPKPADRCQHKSGEKFAIEYSPTDDGKKRRKLSAKNDENDCNMNVQREKKKKGSYQTKLFFVTEMKSDDSDFETETKGNSKRKLVFGKKKHKSNTDMEKGSNNASDSTDKSKTVTEIAQKRKGRESKKQEESDREPSGEQIDTQQVDEIGLDSESSHKYQGLHTERLTREHFKSDSEYAAYVEEQDRLLALQLQADFNMEARFRLSAIRSKGSEGQYKLREKRKRTAKADGIQSLSPKKRTCRK